MPETGDDFGDPLRRRRPLFVRRHEACLPAPLPRPSSSFTDEPVLDIVALTALAVSCFQFRQGNIHKLCHVGIQHGVRAPLVSQIS
jgi:hypothetical protein